MDTRHHAPVEMAHRGRQVFPVIKGVHPEDIQVFLRQAGGFHAHEGHLGHKGQIAVHELGVLQKARRGEGVEHGAQAHGLLQQGQVVQALDGVPKGAPGPHDVVVLGVGVGKQGASTKRAGCPASTSSRA
jgi:hypothetical protein